MKDMATLQMTIQKQRKYSPKKIQDAKLSTFRVTKATPKMKITTLEMFISWLLENTVR